LSGPSSQSETRKPSLIRWLTPVLFLLFFEVVCAGAVPAPDILVVAADGSGDFKTVQQTVDHVAEDNRRRVVIRIKFSASVFLAVLTNGRFDDECKRLDKCSWAAGKRLKLQLGRGHAVLLINLLKCQ
jgi:hypothetical protein